MHLRRATPLGAVLLTRGVVAGIPRCLVGLGTSPWLPLPLFPRLSLLSSYHTSPHYVRAVGCAAKPAAATPSPSSQEPQLPLTGEAQLLAPEASKALSRVTARQAKELGQVVNTAATIRKRTKRTADSSSSSSSSSDSSGTDPALPLATKRVKGCSQITSQKAQRIKEHSPDGADRSTPAFRPTAKKKKAAGSSSSKSKESSTTSPATRGRPRKPSIALTLPISPPSVDKAAPAQREQLIEVNELSASGPVEPDADCAPPAPSALSMKPLSQLQQDIVDDPARAKLIQAVAGSGKTEVLVHIALKAAREGTNVLFVTKVSSVTFEIMNRLKAHLKIAGFAKSGNHYYTGLSSGAVIEVANYDAMVNTQLLHPKLGLRVWLQQYGDAYSRKAERLCELVRSGEVTQLMLQYPKGTPAGMVLVDEMQDFNSTRVEIIAYLAKTNPQLKVVACGDALQSVFSDVINEEDAHLPGQGSHALSTWDMVPDMQRFSMDVCRRCPDPHVRFANAAMRSMHGGKHCIQPMKSSHPGVPGMSEPFLFVHPDLGQGLNYAASITAQQVCLIISHFRKADPSLAPEDVAIIALSTNKNPVFHHLINKLAHLYAKNHQVTFDEGLQHAKHFQTKSDLATITIDWDLAHGKTVMLSVHGDKGRTHKLVVVLDLSHGRFPQKSTVDTTLELVDASIVNVAVTRSERYLAVGVPASGASFYLNPALPGGKAFEPDLPVVASWQAAQLPKDSFFRRMAEELHNVPGVPEPDELKLNQPHPTHQSGPRKLTLSVSTDIAYGFDHPTDLYPLLFKRTSIHSHKFGTPFNFKCDFSLPPSASGDGPPCDTVADTLGAVDEVIGHMANLLLERLHCQRVGDMAGLRAKFDYLTKTTQHHYTSSELLNVSADQRLNDLVEEGSQVGQWRDVLQAAKAAERQPGFNYGSKMECNTVAGQPRYHRPLSNEVKDEVQQLIDQEAPKYILPPYCSTDTFQASVEDYLSDKPCEDLHPSSMWHMAVADQLLSQELRRPVLDLCWDLLAKESWQSLMSNAVYFLDMLHGEAGLASGDMVPPTLIFNCNLSLLAIGGINAHSDIISPRSKHLIEIKTPMNPFKRNGGGVGKALVVKNENPWWIQALTYAVLCPVSIPLHKVSVVNLTAGEMFSLNVMHPEHPCPEGIPVPKRRAVLKKIFAKNNFSDTMMKLLFAKALERYGANADDAVGGNAEAEDGEAVD